jgi:hypothetical protein
MTRKIEESSGPDYGGKVSRRRDIMTGKVIRTAAGSIAAAALLLLTSPVCGQESEPAGSETAPLRSIDERADSILKEMSTYLQGLPRFAFEAEETFDEVDLRAPRTHLSNIRRVAVQRPDRFAADAEGDTLNRASWFDGKNITALDKAQNRYVTVELAGTIDDALELIEGEYGIVVPLEDFLYSDPYAILTEEILYGEYLGIHRAAGVPCHHLAFVQRRIEWQIWIEAGERPLPRKLAIAYVEEPGTPQYAATINRWSTEPEFPGDLFVFTAPEGAEEIDAAALRKPAPAEGAVEGGEAQ